MAAHAPYIMPDGRSLTHYLAQEREREQLRRRKAELRGKDLQFAQLLRQRTSTMSDLELAELKAMENAGVRRRRRWLNDKTLRDLAGPLSAADMESQFKPAPFGMAVPSPLAQAMSPANAALWDNFRNIDPEKEARVLQKWAAHQRESAPLRQRPLSQAALALQRWAAVGKKARAALKRANPSSVMQLEMQILDFFEQAGPTEQLLMPLEDGFARLLVHGLSEFYGLLSASRPDPATGATVVAVYRRAKPPAPGQPDISLGLGASPAAPPHSRPGSSPSPGGSRRGGGGSSSTGPSPARGSVTVPSPVRGGAGSQAAAPTAPAGQAHSPSPSPGRLGSSGRGAAAGASPQPGRAVSAGGAAAGAGAASSGSRLRAEEGPVEHEITCTDVLLAMAEVGQMGLNEEALRRYVHVHIHGTMAADGAHHQHHHHHHQHQQHSHLHIQDPQRQQQCVPVAAR
ncbi:hypothetical protein PLESTB_001502800 [Pleodorina starrii]|uniref:R3H domain-containing protein n=1 Tax=Pleodorina starrii TaxID=330485 RepID=A0A9W6BWL1_9CHLO|nr:hypothetical protein PLESTM_000662900 [Pleodorina starrii]GLC59582.1 hypothetical protein PLESTB_001502800 [Pleodorina starrii]GLC67820.1 hypothetical protein PLESTF_000610900 [Pleodorina starrii]